MKNKKINKAFSLVEVLMATFVFSVIMIGVAGAFSSSVFGYKSGKNIQKDLEQAQFAMSLVAKTIRTSSLVSNPGTSGAIRVYDYSQGKCIIYAFDSSTHVLDNNYAFTDYASCAGNSTWTSGRMIDGGVNNVVFNKTGSAVGVVGKVTISMEVCSNTNCTGSSNDKARLQTTVSLRDYSVSGL